MGNLNRWTWVAAMSCVLGCSDDDAQLGSGSSGSSTDTSSTDTDPSPDADVYRFAGGCFTIASENAWLVAGGGGFSFGADLNAAVRFTLQPADLGAYLLYDPDGGYVVADSGPLVRQTTLDSDVTLLDDTYVSGAVWELQGSDTTSGRYQFRHRKTGHFMGPSGLVPDSSMAVAVRLDSAADCRPHPELSLDASGEVQPRTFDDGSVYGIVDTHSHILSNFGFGGGGIFHGGTFHPLGVEHALPSCEPAHGVNGRKDFFGFIFDSAGASGADISSVLPNVISGELDQDNHATAGYPDFTDWPNGPERSTHQTQYYLWLQRAYLAGLRLVVQHATTNSVICEFMVGAGIQPARYSCNDMVAVDRIIEETYAMERYIDAQSGGPGQGWFRIVLSPAEARDVINEGKMAVVLGIETSDLFDCPLTPDPDGPVCDADYVRQQLDDYYARGVRVMFPVHKYDNAFSAGDGDRAFIELGNFFNTGHWSNFTLDCPGTPVVFDKGDVFFGDLNMPRDEYLAPPVHDFSDFATNPLAAAFRFISEIGGPSLEGDYCQKTGLTVLGETLLLEMMARGMVIEVDHFPQRSYQRAFELLEENDYPAAGTHASNYEGRLYRLGGVSKSSLGRCSDPEQPGTMMQGFRDRIALIEAEGGYPAEGFGFDLNGFAGAPRARFEEGRCATPQQNPVTYPFTSYAGDITFTQPRLGNRVVDFNTEGLVHIGMLPELLEDARRDAASDADLEPLFRSAEGYLRMWEKSEERGAEISGN